MQNSDYIGDFNYAIDGYSQEANYFLMAGDSTETLYSEMYGAKAEGLLVTGNRIQPVLGVITKTALTYHSGSLESQTEGSGNRSPVAFVFNNLTMNTDENGNEGTTGVTLDGIVDIAPLVPSAGARCTGGTFNLRTAKPLLKVGASGSVSQFAQGTLVINDVVTGEFRRKESLEVAVGSNPARSYGDGSMNVASELMLEA